MEKQVIKDVINRLLVEYSSEKNDNIILLFLNKKYTKIRVLLDKIIIINLEPKHQNFIMIPKNKFNFNETEYMYAICLDRNKKYDVWNEIQKKHFLMEAADIKRQVDSYL